MFSIIETLTLGEPWKYSDRSVTIVVPILRTRSSERKYHLLQELKDQLTISDTGVIDSAIIKNPSSSNIFVRSGTILTGKTQTRSVSTSTVVPLKESLTVPVRCVYASKGINRGANLRISKEIAPLKIEQNLLQDSDQSMVWESVQEFTHSMSKYVITSETRLDDLEGVMRSTREFGEEVERLLERIPGDHPEQVGIAVLSLSGVVGVEFFDHPDSWGAFSKSVVRNYSEEIFREAEEDLFEVKLEKAHPLVLSFLMGLLESEKTIAHESSVSITYTMSKGPTFGEYTEMERELIHFIGGKREEPREYRLRPIRREEPSPILDESSRRPASLRLRQRISRADMDLYSLDSYRARKGSSEMINELKEEPLTWGEMEDKVQLSTRTLSKRLKEGMEEGIIDKLERPSNGKSAYSLSAKTVDRLLDEDEDEENNDHNDGER